MKTGIKLLGTNLYLTQGMEVVLEPATNQPDPEGKYFASPFEAAELEVWNRNPTASILIDREDVEITEHKD